MLHCLYDFFVDQNAEVTASLYYELLPTSSFPVNRPLSSSCRALRDLSNQWWTRMLWRQETGAKKQPIQRNGGKQWLLSQDVAHSFLSNKTVQQQTQTVCSGTDSLTYSAHSLSCTEHHGAELWRHQHAGGKLGQWGVTVEGQSVTTKCHQSSPGPPWKRNWSDVTETGCFYPPITSCRACRVTLKKMGLNPNKDTNTAFYWLKGCQVTSISHTILYTVF